jgi:hypothetical protein
MARTMTGSPAWSGSIGPTSPLRAIDKRTWWLGGGDPGTAAEVRDLRQVARMLGRRSLPA